MPTPTALSAVLPLELTANSSGSQQTSLQPLLSTYRSLPSLTYLLLIYIEFRYTIGP